MNVSTIDLEQIRDLCLEHYSEERPNIHSIILYGGAAKTYTGEDHNPRDFDLNVFFSTDAEITSTYGMPEIIGTYQGLKVEVMRNRVPEN